VYRVLLWKSRRRTSHGKHRRRWEGNIKIGLRKNSMSGGMDWFCSGWGQVASSCERDNETSGFVTCWEILDQLRNCQPLKNGC
jgi:hypothetical protein